jgi:phosphoglycolate phosphatase-like HAD superfamily hydrolase
MAAPLRAIIFDFDGVILDSNDVKTDVFRQVFGRFPEHAAAMMAYHQAHVSQSRYAKFTHLVEQRLGRPGDRELIEQLADDFAARARERLERCAFVPGARELLEEMSARVPLYLASVTPEPELLHLLGVHDIRRHFTRVFGCPPWTKPGAVGAIVEAHGGPAGLALIGDSAGDQRAAAAHGVEFIGRDSGLAFDSPLEPIRDIPDLASLLRTRLAA